jgi:hypothetical protein
VHTVSVENLLKKWNDEGSRKEDVNDCKPKLSVILEWLMKLKEEVQLNNAINTKDLEEKHDHLGERIVKVIRDETNSTIKEVEGVAQGLQIVFGSMAKQRSIIGLEVNIETNFENTNNKIIKCTDEMKNEMLNLENMIGSNDNDNRALLEHIKSTINEGVRAILDKTSELNMEIGKMCAGNDDHLQEQMKRFSEMFNGLKRDMEIMYRKNVLRENYMLGATEACKENTERILKKALEIIDTINEKQGGIIARYVARINSSENKV